MFIKENYKSTRSLKTKYIIFHKKFSSSDRKMDFYLTTSASTLPRFQITWKSIHRILYTPLGALALHIANSNQKENKTSLFPAKFLEDKTIKKCCILAKGTKYK